MSSSSDFGIKPVISSGPIPENKSQKYDKGESNSLSRVPNPAGAQGTSEVQENLSSDQIGSSTEHDQPKNLKDSQREKIIDAVIYRLMAIIKWSPLQVARIRRNMIRHLEDQKGKQLTSEEKKGIDDQLKTLVKINNMSKSLLGKVEGENAKAPWTVRQIVQVKIGDDNVELQLGRNYKALLMYKTAVRVGLGGKGIVDKVGIELKSNIEILQKRLIENNVPEQMEQARNGLIKEGKITDMLHRNRGGYQTGIQYSPYRVGNYYSEKLGYLVRGYKISAEPKKLVKLNPAEKKELGLKGKKGPGRLMLGLFQGLNAAHKNGVAHRDIKPENAGFQKAPNGRMEACLADFGEAVESTNPDYWIAGTPNYYCPGDVSAAAELKKRGDLTQIEKDEKIMELHKKKDMFGLARTVLEMMDALLFNRAKDEIPYIFGQNTPLQKELDKYINSDEFDQRVSGVEIKKILDAVEVRMGKKARDLLFNMLDRDPSRRPGADEAEKIWKAAC